MTSDQQEASPASAEASAQAAAPPADVQSSSASSTAKPADPAAQSGATAPARSALDEANRPAAPQRPRIKIGTQREGVAAPRIPPRVATVFRTTGPGGAAAEKGPATVESKRTDADVPRAKHAPQKHPAGQPSA
jgi:hypothetical protein